MENDCYKVTGKFEVYDRDNILLTDQLFCNKIFETAIPQAARNMALAFAKGRAAKKYGKGVSVKRVGNLMLRKSHAPVKKKKKDGKKNQLNLF